MIGTDATTLSRIAACLDATDRESFDRAPAVALAYWLGSAARAARDRRASSLVASVLSRPARRRLGLELRRAGLRERMTWRRRVDRAVAAGPPAARRALLEACLHRPTTRLAVYGTLVRGGCNHDQVAEIHGRWRRGSVRGHVGLVARGIDRGHRVLRPDPVGPAVPVEVLESEQLPAHWARLDDFEGVAYRRVLLPVELEDGPTRLAWGYVDATADGRSV